VKGGKVLLRGQNSLGIVRRYERNRLVSERTLQKETEKKGLTWPYGGEPMETPGFRRKGGKEVADSPSRKKLP